MSGQGHQWRPRNKGTAKIAVGQKQVGLPSGDWVRTGNASSLRRYAATSRERWPPRHRLKSAADASLTRKNKFAPNLGDERVSCTRTCTMDGSRLGFEKSWCRRNFNLNCCLLEWHGRGTNDLSRTICNWKSRLQKEKQRGNLVELGNLDKVT